MEKVDEMSLESDDDDRVQPVSKFGLLNIEDAGGSDSEPDSDTVSSATKQTKQKRHIVATKVEDKIINKGAAKKQGSKGKDKVDTKKSKDEEDIDELVAELEAPKSTKPGEKKDRKKKKGGNVEDTVDEANTSMPPNMSATVEPEIDYRNMTQDEIARLMEEQYGEDSEEERKKAKSKKKARKAKDETKQTENGEMEKMSGKVADKTSAVLGKDDEKNADADVDVEVTKPAKKQTRKAQRKQTEVLFVGILHVLFCKAS